MNRISQRDIQMVVAGAMALMGLQALFAAPYYLFATNVPMRVFGLVFEAIALLIALAMVNRNQHAVIWAGMFLGVEIIGALAGIFVPLLLKSPTPSHLHWWQSAYDLPGPVILLGLLIWSRFGKFARN